MKKIIKRGRKKIFTCKYCGCVFEADKYDYTRRIAIHMSPDVPNEWVLYSVCPECEHDVDLVEGKM